MDTPTHSGGIVVRRDDGRLRFLLVTARSAPGEWVLPKGHIERGESAADTAAREVLEEAGVTALPGEVLGELEYYGRNGRIRVRFLLMEFQSEGSPGEERDRAWLDAGEARRRLKHEDARALIARAEQLTSQS